MSTYTYQEVLKQVEHLAPEDQERLLEDLKAILRRRTRVGPKQHSITELRGLGKEIWEGIDAQEYVNQERASWEK
jgi:hypothetical protein